MEITGIKKAQSKQGHIVIETDPPVVAQEVYDKFCEFETSHGFTFENGSFIWSRDTIPSAEIMQELTTYLTETRNMLSADQTRAMEAEELFLKQASQVTGLPLI